MEIFTARWLMLSVLANVVLPALVHAASIPDSLKETYEAALNANAGAQYVMGRYHFKKGTQEDYLEAEKWFDLAARQDHAEAVFWLGRMVSMRSRTPEDDAKIVKLYRRAVSVAKKNDGNMINNGQERRGRDSGAPSRSLAGA